MPGRPPASAPQRGFTLVEILVVVVLIGLVAATAVIALTAGGFDTELEQEGRRVRSLVALASEEAVMQGRDFGIELHRHGYTFFEFDYFTNEWAELVDDPLLRARELPPGTEAALEVEGRRLVLPLEPEPEPAPQVLVLSSGELTPFILELSRTDGPARVRVEGEVTGRVELDTEIAAGLP